MAFYLSWLFIILFIMLQFALGVALVSLGLSRFFTNNRSGATEGLL